MWNTPDTANALLQPLRTLLVPQGEDSPVKEKQEKRLDDYLDGLFWITVFGLAFILGGTVLLKKVEVSNWLVFGYMLLSSVAFLINFGLSLWGVARITKQGRPQEKIPSPNTSELTPHEALPLPPAASVTENTTRSFEPIYAKRKTE